MEALKKNVYRTSSPDGVEVIVKKSRAVTVRTPLLKIMPLLAERVDFARERHLLQCLVSFVPKGIVSVPVLLGVAPNSVTSEYVRGVPELDFSVINKTDFAKGLVEVQLAGAECQLPFRISVFDRFANIPLSIVRRMIKHILLQYRIALFFSLLHRLVSACLRVDKSERPVLLHRDLLISGASLMGQKVRQRNLLSTDEGRVYLIDFGSARIERKWLFKDIFDLCFDSRSIAIDKELVQLYMKELRRVIPSRKGMDYFRARVALLHCVLVAFDRKGSPDMLFDFLAKNVADEAGFHSWIEELFEV